MAKKNTKNLRDVQSKILRSYDIYSLEKRIYDLENGGAPTPAGGGDKYSESEIEIGTWIDDSKVYRKVLHNTSISTMTIGTTYDIANVSALNIGKLIRVSTMLLTASTSSSIGLDNASCWIADDGTLKIKASATSWSNITNIYVIIDYVKTV